MAIWLNEADIRAVLPMAELIDVMRNALLALSSGKVEQPLRSVIAVEPRKSVFSTMPAHAPTLSALGAKLVTVFGGNPSRGLPSHLATILLLDTQTGGLLAVMDGRFITEARTAAVSAVAADCLAQANTPVLAILGSGVQARSHLEALPLVRTFHEIRCWSPTAANVQRFISESHVRVTACESAEAAVRGADVVALVTASSEPVIQKEWVKPGACVISVGACVPYQREMDPALVCSSRLIVDSRVSALGESGDVILSGATIAAELGEVLQNRSLGRTSESEIVVFKSLGLAVEDVAAAQLAYQRSIAMGKGIALA